jgi:hypothetical protein
MNMEQLAEGELTVETEALRENLPQCYFIHHKSHMTGDRTWAAEVGSWKLTS